MFDYHFMYGSNEQHGWARPITVLPTMMTSEWSYKDFFHVKEEDLEESTETITALRNFICGLDISEPKAITDTCKETIGNWTFYNFTLDSCPIKWGFYAAKWQGDCSKSMCKGLTVSGKYGFMEFSEPTKSF